MTVFLDMDGVISDFVLGVSRLFKFPYEKLIECRNWDIHTPMGLTESDMWTKINENGEDFWVNLEKYPWSDRLVNGLTNKFGLENVFILSDAGKKPKTSSGKQEWICKNYPQFNGRVILTSYKYLLAHKRAILIDDKPLNIYEFEGSYGTGFLFPQPWNLSEVHAITDPEDFVTYLLA